jgi:hypothetical protein
MKYRKKFFKIKDNPNKIYLRIQIIKDYIKGAKLIDIAKKEKCTIKTGKKWVVKFKLYINLLKQLIIPKEYIILLQKEDSLMRFIKI